MPKFLLTGLTQTGAAVTMKKQVGENIIRGSVVSSGTRYGSRCFNIESPELKKALFNAYNEDEFGWTTLSFTYIPIPDEAI